MGRGAERDLPARCSANTLAKATSTSAAARAPRRRRAAARRTTTRPSASTSRRRSSLRPACRPRRACKDATSRSSTATRPRRRGERSSTTSTRRCAAPTSCRRARPSSASTASTSGGPNTRSRSCSTWWLTRARSTTSRAIPRKPRSSRRSARGSARCATRRMDSPRAPPSLAAAGATTADVGRGARGKPRPAAAADAAGPVLPAGAIAARRTRRPARRPARGVRRRHDRRQRPVDPARAAGTGASFSHAPNPQRSQFASTNRAMPTSPPRAPRATPRHRRSVGSGTTGRRGPSA